MKKVLFYTQNRWAFGSIHHGLIKELYKHNIYSNLLDWTKRYTEEEFKYLNSVYDLFVTNPEAVMSLHQIYKIPLKKIVTVAHGQWDMLLTKEKHGTDFYSELYNFGVVSEILKTKSKEFGINTVPNIVELGIHTEIYQNDVSTELKTIGYGGMKETKNYFGEEIKRGWMVEKALQGLNVNFKFNYELNHLCMAGYFKTIDCLIVSSSEESAGLPAMEAAAAGKLVLGTPVGYFERNAVLGGGVLLPLDEENFIKKLREIVLFYQNNPHEYRQRCLQIQKFAQENYDWKNKVDKWINLFDK
jgi:glycosyltransferase involved in cell wall biosynthesis